VPTDGRSPERAGAASWRRADLAGRSGVSLAERHAVSCESTCRGHRVSQLARIRPSRRRRIVFARGVSARPRGTSAMFRTWVVSGCGRAGFTLSVDEYFKVPGRRTGSWPNGQGPYGADASRGEAGHRSPANGKAAARPCVSVFFKHQQITAHVTAIVFERGYPEASRGGDSRCSTLVGLRFRHRVDVSR